MSFPTTSVLDNFNRADQGPPPSSNWTGYFDMQLAVSNNTLVPVVNGDDCSGVWNPNSFTDSEVYITLTTLGATSDKWSMVLRAQSGTFPGNSPSAYEIDYVVGGSSVRIRRRDVGTGNTLNTLTHTFASGDGFGVSIVGTVITVYYETGAGAWTSLGTYDTSGDATKYSSGYIGVDMFTGSNTHVMVGDNFGGGTPTVGFTTKMRKTLTLNGTRIGSRQVQASWP